MVDNRWLRGGLLAVALAAVGCGSDSPTNGNGSGGSVGVGGSGTTGGVTTSSSSGGTSAVGSSTQNQTGGTKAGTSATGGKATTGGNASSGGTTADETSGETGGSGNGGTKATGGTKAGGGTQAGGATTGTKATGGATSGGGAKPTGGTTAAAGATTGPGVTGGATAAGGTSTAGGAATGGTSAAGGSTPAGVTVELDKTHQKIQGFGINDTWANEAMPSKLFATSGTDWLGLTILRVGLGDNGQDMSSNIAGDITMAKAAGAKIIGSCWSPPANCKQPAQVNDGGHLLTSCHDSWSETIADWAESKGLYAMSIGNEPDFASCGSVEPCNGNYPTTLFTAKELVSWVKVAGKKLQSRGIKVIAPEASEWIHNWSNISATGSEPSNKNSSDPLKCGCYGNVIDAATEAKCSANCASGNGYDYGHWLAKDDQAWAAFDIMGVHQYDSTAAVKWPSDVTDGKVTKEIWQTEMSGVKWWPEQGPSSDIKNGVAVAGWIHSALVVGEASAWLWWWYKAYNTDDNEGLLLKNGTVTKRYWVLGNYSRWVRPGQEMVDVTGNSNADHLISAFKGTDTVVVVAINKSATAATVPITITGGTAPASCTPNVTSANDNLKAGTAIPVSEGTFSAALAATSVTTFVCK